MTRVKIANGMRAAFARPGCHAPRIPGPRNLGPRNLGRSIARRIRGFGGEEGGALIIFALFIFVLMLMVGGMAVDLMRYENTRTRLQNTVDRAVLAAASLNQTLSPQAVVNDFFTKAGLSQYLVAVNVDEGLNYRTVSAQANANVPTMFMNMSGIDSLPAPTSGTAQEKVSNVEISLVLDISGSMGRNNKINYLRTAAKQFVATVLKPDAVDKVTVSLIPYTAQVNAGPDIFDQLWTRQMHNYSHCIDFDTSDFNATGLDFGKRYEQMQHFEWSSASYKPIRNPGCPMRSYERIKPLSQSVSALQNTIDQLRARANTSIHIGMKWGAALLDPTSQPIVQGLVDRGVVDNVFSNRPAAWNDKETMKVVVLMTDGENVSTYRIKNWAYNSSSEYAYWNRHTLWNYLYNHVSYSNRSHYYYRKYSASQADGMLNNICNAAKAKGIIVYTIGFEVGNHGANVMESCATSPSHFFRVEGVEISSAFAAIASNINRLKLIQ